MSTMSYRMASALWLLPLLLGACEDGDAGSPEAEEKSPVAFEAHECAACGMIVREQPAPRAQLLHRDGTRAHFCAIGDLLTYLAAPSPHGAAENVWVEVLPAESRPSDYTTDPMPWSAADEAVYVVGVDRVVMGTPVMVYASEADAEATANADGAEMLSWDGLQRYVRTSSTEDDHANE